MAKEYGIIAEPTSLSTHSNQWEMGWAFTIGSKDVRVVGLRAKLPAAQTVTGNLWSAAGTLLASCTIAVISGQWVEALFDTPVVLEANTQYIVSCYNSANRYASTVSAFTYNAKIASVQGGRYISTKGSFPANSEANNMYPLIDIVINDIVKHVLSGSAEFAVQVPENVGVITGSKIKWSCEVPSGTSLSVWTKAVGGTYARCVNNGPIMGIPQNVDLSGSVVYVRVDMSTSDELVTPSLSSLTLRLLGEGDDHVLTLLLPSGVTRSIQNAVGTVEVEYAGGTLLGLGGAVAPFAISFTPEGLVVKNNPNDVERVEISTIEVSAALSRIVYTHTYATEYMAITDVIATGTLTHIDDI